MKEADIAYFKYYPTILIEELEKTTKTLAACFQTQIRKLNLLNTRTKPKICHSTVKLDFKLNERNRFLELKVG
jgi:vacuolar-type H+-ATPase subunit D/Vma8